MMSQRFSSFFFGFVIFHILLFVVSGAQPGVDTTDRDDEKQVGKDTRKDITISKDTQHGKDMHDTENTATDKKVGTKNTNTKTTGGQPCNTQTCTDCIEKQQKCKTIAACQSCASTGKECDRCAQDCDYCNVECMTCPTSCQAPNSKCTKCAGQKCNEQEQCSRCAKAKFLKKKYF
uniref:Uncharacterized protein n=1 Tax=Meloidogyne incognita TaxID=6306 RepID=A0A914KS40_MELIC